MLRLLKRLPGSLLHGSLAGLAFLGTTGFCRALGDDRRRKELLLGRMLVVPLVNELLAPEAVRMWVMGGGRNARDLLAR